MNEIQLQPDDAAGNFKPATPASDQRYGDKNAVAKMIGVSKRTVENLMAQGLPHLALGRRRTRFEMDEVRAWLRQKFRTQRRGKLCGNAGKGGAQ